MLPLSLSFVHGCSWKGRKWEKMIRMFMHVWTGWSLVLAQWAAGEWVQSMCWIKMLKWRMKWCTPSWIIQKVYLLHTCKRTITHQEKCKKNNRLQFQAVGYLITYCTWLSLHCATFGAVVVIVPLVVVSFQPHHHVRSSNGDASVTVSTEWIFHLVS